MSRTVIEVSKTATSTSVVAGLSWQILREIDAIAPGALVRVDNPYLRHAYAHVFPYLQPPAAAACERALMAYRRPVVVTSMYRALPQQLLLRLFHLQKRRVGGRLLVTLAAEPGNSYHEVGLAKDVRGYRAARPCLEAEGWDWLGPADPWHFTYRGSGPVRRDLGTVAVRAFQRLWNRYNPTKRIAEDGVFGPKTRHVLLYSPAGGWN